MPRGTPGWTGYYDAMAGRPPRETLLRALAAYEAAHGPANGAPLAVDLGCGEGRDTMELLRRGFRVIAVDSEPEAIKRLCARPDLSHAGRLETHVARIEDARWPAAAIVNASFSLPFCRPEAFADTWRRMIASLRPGGRFCGQLLGEHDDWAGERALTVHRRAEVEALLAGLAVEWLEEEDQDGSTATGAPKHWHLFHIVARKDTGARQDGGDP
jgi:SAM-dependent methyltransferase